MRAFSVTLAGVLLLSTTTSKAELDFNPKYVASAIEGPPIKRPYFSDGNRKYAFKINDFTEIYGSASLAKFVFKNRESSQLELSRSPFTPATPFEGEELEAYFAAARQKLPAEAKTVLEVARRQDPYRMNGWTSYSFEFEYFLLRRPMKHSICFLNFDDKQQLILSVVAPKNDFLKANSDTHRILNSLHEVTPESEERAKIGN